MRKQVITIQIDPMVLSKVWQYGKDQGLAKQVAIEHLILKGLRVYHLNKWKEINYAKWNKEI